MTVSETYQHIAWRSLQMLMPAPWYAASFTHNTCGSGMEPRAAYNNEKKDAHHEIYIEFASRRAHRNNVDARRDFFLVDVMRHARQRSDDFFTDNSNYQEVLLCQYSFSMLSR